MGRFTSSAERKVMREIKSSLAPKITVERPRMDCYNCQYWQQRTPYQAGVQAWGICQYRNDDLVRVIGPFFTRESFFCQGFSERQERLNTVTSPPL